MPSYCEASQSESTFSLSCAPDSDDEADDLLLSVSDSDTTVSATVNVLIYNTYFVGDVRPSGGEAAGEFGDDMVVAPDVINALKVATEAPGTEIPDSTSNLFDAFDSSPMEVDSIDVNGDGDFYDEGERGGDGHIEVADVIVSLNRATLIPGYPNVRRVDNNYPYSSNFSDRNSRSQDLSDMIVLGSITAMPGETGQIPVTLIRGESESSLTGLVSGFAVTYDNDVELSQPLSFTADIDCFPLNVPTDNNFLSLLLMNIDGQSPRSELLLGHISFKVPEDAHDGDIFTFSSQGESGTNSNYESILFLEGIAGTLTVSTSYLAGDVNFDGTVNIQDIMVMINIILPPEDDYTDETLEAADLNGDGVVNILDIMIALNITLRGDMARVAPADKVTLYFGNNLVSYNANGAVAGFQMEVAGEYEITNSALPEGWEMHYNEGILVIFSMDGSSLESSTLFEYTGNMTIESVIVSDIEGNAILASSVIVPSKYALESAYPNPFNPTTTLSFAIPVASEVSLSIYNLKGREVASLIDGIMDAGYHSVVWNADNHSSGVYFVKMLAGEFVNTQKLMLVK